MFGNPSGDHFKQATTGYSTQYPAREIRDPDSTEHAIIQRPEFSPYVNNGGTTVAVAGKDFAVIAADTRLSLGYSIQTRNACKMTALTSKCVIASSGMQADMSVLFKRLQFKAEKYQNDHHKELSTPSAAQLLSNTLYYKRFFPYYTFNVLAGIDENGVGCVYGYDAVGSFERQKYGCSGSGSALVLPVLDSQVGNHNSTLPARDLTKDEAIELVRDTMTSAGERDIYTGDYIDMAIIDATGISWKRFDLKLD